MKSTSLYIVLAILFIYLIASVLAENKNEYNWDESYDMYSTEPYASSVLNEVVKRNPNVINMFVSEFPIIDMDLNEFSENEYSLFFVNSRLVFESESAERLLTYVEFGNTVFLSAYSIDMQLLSELNLKISANTEYLKDTIFTATLVQDDVKQSFQLKSKKGQSSSNYFSSIPKDMEILGYNMNSEPNFVRTKIDDGYIYLHLMPKAFANLNIVDEKNIKYADAVFEFIKTNNYYFDNYYKGSYRFVNESSSAFDYIFNNPKLGFAYYLALALILLFLLLNTRRKQNIMKLHARPVNKTKEFAYTIAQLYYSRKDNKSIAKTEISFLMNHFRESYHYQKLKLNASLAEEIAYQSGCNKKLIINIFNKIIQINKSKTVESEDLLSLTELIKEYHKTRV